MKNDRYLKIILTIIAICLVWICVRDIKIGGSNLHATEGQQYAPQRIKLVGITGDAFKNVEPIKIEVVNLQQVPQPEDEWWKKK